MGRIQIVMNRGLLRNIFGATDKVVDGFAEDVTRRAKDDHEWRDDTGATREGITWDRRKNVVALKVAKGKGVWFELGWNHKPYGKHAPVFIRKPGLTKAFDAMKDKLAGRLKDVVR